MHSPESLILPLHPYHHDDADALSFPPRKLPKKKSSCAATITVVEKGSPFVRITRKTFEKILTERLDKWSNGTNINMSVECDPTSTLLQLLRGQFHCDATVNLDRIVFGNIRFSGGQLQAKNFGVNLLSFAPNTLPLPLAPSPRFPRQFDLVAQNLTCTQDDLCESSCIRNGLRRLLTRILKNRGLAALNVSIQSIQVLQSGKVTVMPRPSHDTLWSARVV
jgi:hypothetical protein